MSRISETFARLKEEKRKALILYLSAGDPSMRATEKLIPELFKAGGDIIEIGVPFSDPLADGPIIQKSFVKSLKRGTNLKQILAMVTKVRKVTDKPLVLMSAYNIIYNHGLKKFAADAAKAGVDGVILPDLIPEEAGEILPLLEAKGIDPIFLAAPTSGKDRVKKVASVTKGFLYYISVSGITGQKKPTTAEVKRQVELIRKQTKTPVACGFGISTPEQAKAIGAVTDGVIIGSALVRIVSESGKEAAKEAVKFVKKMRKALDS